MSAGSARGRPPPAPAGATNASRSPAGRATSATAAPAAGKARALAAPMPRAPAGLGGAPRREPAAGKVVLRGVRVGMTANNVTYAVMGDAMHYWVFFPTADRDGVAQGRVPLWGFAVVERSRAPGVEEGTRLYGYLPTS